VPPSSNTGIASVSADESLTPFFQTQQDEDFRATWDVVQNGFVDDPQQAVRRPTSLSLKS
jgi:hypothetical protein